MEICKAAVLMKAMRELVEYSWWRAVEWTVCTGLICPAVVK